MMIDIKNNNLCVIMEYTKVYFNLYLFFCFFPHKTAVLVLVLACLTFLNIEYTGLTEVWSGLKHLKG